MSVLINKYNIIINNNTDLNHKHLSFETLNCDFIRKQKKIPEETNYIILETSEFILQEDNNLIEIEF